MVLCPHLFNVLIINANTLHVKYIVFLQINLILSVRICIPCSVTSVNREVVELYFRLNMADTERIRVSFHEKLHELLSRKNHVISNRRQIYKYG